MAGAGGGGGGRRARERGAERGPQPRLSGAGPAGQSWADNRLKGFQETLAAESPGIKVVAESRLADNRNSALTTAEDWLQRFPTLTGIYSATDDIGGRAVPRAEDQRHTAHFDWSYHPESNAWRLSVAGVWHTGTPDTPEVISVDTLVKRVRRKIESDPAEPRFILTVWGTGYKFADV